MSSAADWIDPRDWGARFDGLTDDLPALRAMAASVRQHGAARVNLPHGTAYLSDRWIITRMLKIYGAGGDQSNEHGFEVASGRTALHLDNIVVSADKSGSAFHDLRGFNINSRVLIHPTLHGSGLGRSTKTYSANGVVRLGECFAKPNGIDPESYFRAIAIESPTGTADALLGRVASKFAAAMPLWPLDIGATIVSNGITWRTESFPQLHVEKKAYALGQQVLGWNDNRYLYTCIKAGTSAPIRPAQLIGGATPFTQGVPLGGRVVDGEVEWLVNTACGLLVESNFGVIDRLHVTHFLGGALHVQGGLGQDARGITDVNNARIRDVSTWYCGLGIYLGGDNCNGWTLDAFNAMNMGSLHPSPLHTFPYRDGARGGHIVHDHSMASGRVVDLYAQLSTGASILKTGIGRMTVDSCYHELGSELFNQAYNRAGIMIVVGGNIRPTKSSVGVMIIDPLDGRGIRERDATNPALPLRVGLTMQDGKHIRPFFSPEPGDPGFVAEKYEAGYLITKHGEQAQHTAESLSMAKAGLDPGVGWRFFDDGYFVGKQPGALFRGPITSLRLAFCRMGLRLPGDEFYDGVTTTITSKGYRAMPWSPGARNVGMATWGIPPAMCEPRSNTGAPGEKVFVLIATGTTGTTEPNWSTATAVGNTVTDGTVVWSLIGFTPTFAKRTAGAA